MSISTASSDITDATLDLVLSGKKAPAAEATAPASTTPSASSLSSSTLSSSSSASSAVAAAPAVASRTQYLDDDGDADDDDDAAHESDDDEAPSGPPPSIPAPKSRVEHVCLVCDAVAHSDDAIQAHLLQTHRIVIGDSHKIALFPRYLQYWKQRLTAVPITAIASQIKATGSGAGGAGGGDDLYYLLSDILPEDRHTRLALQRDLLSEMLEKQSDERQDKGKARPCLFCRQAPRGRDELFEHMREAHGFAVGQPDNLVGIDRLLDVLRAKLDGLQCIYCERIFKDYATLRVHMKKKRHFKVNGRNKIYDQFYLINYLEWGKTWEDLQREPDDDGESETTLSTVSEIDPWRDWEEAIDESDMFDEPTICPVCNASCVNAALALSHLAEEHDVDLIKLRREWNLDVYAAIKLINYLRWCHSVAHKCARCALQCANSAELLAHAKAERHLTPLRDAPFWDDAQFLIPVIDNDPLLRAPDLFGDDDNWSDDEEGVAAIRNEALAARAEFLAKRGAALDDAD